MHTKTISSSSSLVFNNKLAKEFVGRLIWHRDKGWDPKELMGVHNERGEGVFPFSSSNWPPIDFRGGSLIFSVRF